MNRLRLLSSFSCSTVPTHACHEGEGPTNRLLSKEALLGDTTEKDYRKERIAIAYQIEDRRLERERRQLKHTTRERTPVGGVPLHDHDVAQVWDMLFRCLAALKVKTLHHVQDLQAAVP